MSEAAVEEGTQQHSHHIVVLIGILVLVIVGIDNRQSAPRCPADMDVGGVTAAETGV
jgi:hypothetical protein